MDVSQFFKTGWCLNFTQKRQKSVRREEDYSSMSAPLTLWKILIMFAQISTFFNNAFSKYQCGFQKGYSTQHCNFKMFEKWKKCVAKEKFSVLY